MWLTTVVFPNRKVAIAIKLVNKPTTHAPKMGCRRLQIYQVGEQKTVCDRKP